MKGSAAGISQVYPKPYALNPKPQKGAKLRPARRVVAVVVSTTGKAPPCIALRGIVTVDLGFRGFLGLEGFFLDFGVSKRL